MKRRLLSLLLALSLILSLLSGCGGNNKNSNDSGAGDDASSAPAYMTRGEWIALLGQTFGMEEFLSETTHYTDVGADDPIYAYLQSNYEWGVLALEEGNTFHADEPATKAFVAETAVLATGILSASEEEEADNASVDEIRTYATDNGVIQLSGSDWDANMTMAEGQAAAAVALDLYFNYEEEEVITSTYTEGVVDMTASTAEITVSGSEVTMPAELAADLTQGSVFVSPPTADDPFGVAMKVTSVTIDGDTAVLQTKEPDLGEVFDELKIHTTAVPNLDAATLAEGVTISTGTSALASAGEEYVLDLLVNRDDQTEAQQTASGLSFNFNVNFTKGTMGFTPGWGDLQASVESLIPADLREMGDFGASPADDLGQLFEKSNFVKSIPITKDGIVQMDENGMEQVINISNKFTGGYQITGNVGFSDFYIKPTIEFKKVFGVPTGLKRVAVEINNKVYADLNLEGSISEELTIAKMPIPVGGGVTAELSVVLFVDVNGQIQVRAEVTNNIKIEYEKGFKKTKKTSQDISGGASVEIDAGVAPTVLLKALGIKVIDGKFKISLFNGKTGMKLVYTKSNETVITEDGLEGIQATIGCNAVLETTISLPVIKVEVGSAGTLANKLKIKGSWTLLPAEKAPLHWKPEPLNKTWPLWTLTLDVEVIENPTDEDYLDQLPDQLPTEGDDTTPSDDDYLELLPEQLPSESTDPYASLVIDKMLITLSPGGHATITVTNFPAGEDMSDVTFRSLNTSVATVDSNGVVYAVAAGNTQIYVETPSGGLQICAVTVNDSGSTIDSSGFL